MIDDIVIVGAARTPVGNLNGAFSSLPAHDLGSIAIKAALERAKLDPKQVNEVIIGQILVAGQGQNPARQASLNAGIPVDAPAWGINQLDGSGLRAVALGAQQLIEGNANVVLAGGQESMTLAPHFAYLRTGTKMGHLQLTDSMLYDGLTDVFSKYHMGMTAENVAQKYQITKRMQDEFATGSQNKAEVAQKSGRFKDEIVPVTIKGRKGDKIVDTDEFPRHGVTVDQLAKIRPAFIRDGTVTAGNASGINDGAAMVVLMRRSDAEKGGHPILARIVAWAHAGVDPAIMGTGPIPASRAVLKKAGWKIEDLDLIEANEAFAAQACAVNKDLGWDTSKVNVNGGAIALGHPIGASGTRILTTLLYEMQKRNAKKGLATLSIGGGMGIAMCVERDADPSGLVVTEGRVSADIGGVIYGSGNQLSKPVPARPPIDVSPHAVKAPPKRNLNAWIDDAAPQIGRPFNITIKIGIPDPTAIASAVFSNKNSGRPINLVIALSSPQCNIDPAWQELVLPPLGDSEMISFNAMSNVEGRHVFSIDVYLAKQMILVQSLTFVVSVASSKAEVPGGAG